MKIKDCHKIFFIGIGGIGMSAIARYLHSEGKKIYGYDKTVTALTRTLESEGLLIHYTDSVEMIPEGIDLVIYTPAIPDEHGQFLWFKENGYPVIKRAEALGWISSVSKTIAVAGTHGKTSTSSMITQVLMECGVHCSAFLGGISYGFDSNYLNRGNDWIVVEADEYDRSFLHLEPEIAVLISMDPDHLDIYGDHEVMKEGFWLFVMKIKRGGLLLYKAGLEDMFPADWEITLREKEIRFLSYGINEGEIKSGNVKVEEGRFLFDFKKDKTSLKNIVSAMPGRHNIENATAALSVGLEVGQNKEKLKIAIGKFKGIFRRFERLYDGEKIIYVDDYAHHPTELRAAISAAKELFPEKKVLGIFQPHLFSRTRDFYLGFADALGLLDDVVLMPIYPARELPIAGVSSELIYNEISNENKKILKGENEILKHLNGFKEGVIMTLGAGDIDLLRKPIIKYLKSIHE